MRSLIPRDSSADSSRILLSGDFARPHHSWYRLVASRGVLPRTDLVLRRLGELVESSARHRGLPPSLFRQPVRATHKRRLVNKRGGRPGRVCNEKLRIKYSGKPPFRTMSEDRSTMREASSNLGGPKDCLEALSTHMNTVSSTS
jgi:hypothetical protein